MHNRSQIRPYQSGFFFNKSKSTGNFFRIASERSINHDSFRNQSKDECLACTHQKVHGEKKIKPLVGPAKSKLRQSNVEQYYATQDNQIANLRKAKRYLQELLQKNRNQLRKNSQQYQSKLQILSRQLEQKTEQLTKLQISYSHLQAQQKYKANASLVSSYKQIAPNNQDEDLNKNKKVKELAKKISQLQLELAEAQQQIQGQRKTAQLLYQKAQKLKDYQYYAQEYEAMRALICKMQIQKLQMLDRHQEQLSRQQDKFKIDIDECDQKIVGLKSTIESKSKEIELLEKELKEVRNEISVFKTNQFQNLKELLDQKERESQALESKLACLESSVNFLKSRYGYVLKLARNDQLNEQNENEEYCIERVNRFNVSAGKESLLGMNMSPIRKR